MTDIRFDPTFTHVDWVDNRDRVEAAGPNGFNNRFRDIRADLEEIGRQMSVIDTSIKQLGQQAPPQAQLLSLPPLFSPFQTTAPWGFSEVGNAVLPQDGETTEVAGQMAVPLPDKVRLLTMKVVGSTDSQQARLNIVLGRVTLAGAEAAPQPLARLVSPAPFGDAGVDQAKARVDMSAFRYLVFARASGAAPGDTISISSVQITYIAD